MAIIDPHTTEDQLQTHGDYRPMLGAGPLKSGLKMHMIGAASSKERVEGVILPSFDFRLDTCDQAFQQSVGAFWKDAADPKHPKHFLPNGWAVPLICYTFMGQNNEHFISPSNRAQMLGAENCSADDKADAFNDLWCSIKFDKGLSDQDKNYFLKKPDAKTDAKVPNRQTRFFSFANITTKETRNAPSDVVVCYTGASHTHMVEQARWRNEEGDRVIDPQWSRYMLGDPTRVGSAMVWTVDKRLLDPKDQQETNCILWTSRRELLDDPIHTRVITPEMLAKRFVLIDPECWNIPTYQEQVDFMLAQYHEEVTSEMIRRACGSRADVGERKFRPRSTSSSPQPASDVSDDYNPMQAAISNAAAPKSFAPASPPPPASPPASPPPAAAAQVESPAPVWVSMPGASPTQSSVAELQAKYDAGERVLMVMVGNEWKSIADSGMVVAAPSAPPAGPPVGAPAGPPSTAPVGASASVSLDDTRRSVFDDATYATLSPEKKKEVDEVVTEIHAATVAGKSMPPEIVDRVMQLMGGM